MSGDMKTDPNIEPVVNGQGLELPAAPKTGLLSRLSAPKTELGNGLTKLNLENKSRVDFQINNTHSQGNGETFKLSAENLATGGMKVTILDKNGNGNTHYLNPLKPGENHSFGRNTLGKQLSPILDTAMGTRQSLPNLGDQIWNQIGEEFKTARVLDVGDIKFSDTKMIHRDKSVVTSGSIRIVDGTVDFKWDPEALANNSGKGEIQISLKRLDNNYPVDETQTIAIDTKSLEDSYGSFQEAFAGAVTSLDRPGEFMPDVNPISYEAFKRIRATVLGYK